MLLVIDIGNTRTKWAHVNEDGSLQEVQVCFNADVSSSSALKRALKTSKEVLIANVAGEAMAQQISALVPSGRQAVFMAAKEQACGVVNRYQQSQTLGIDRWAAIIAVWNMNKQPSIVVNAGTMVTIDAIARDAGTKKGLFLGGTIMPGLLLMHQAISANGAQLKAISEGKLSAFPTNTQDAVRTGCINAIIGAIVIMQQQLEKHSAYLPKLIISGGDANKIADALKPHLKRVIIAENLVLQGLVLLGKEAV